MKPGRSCVTKLNCCMFISFQEDLKNQVAVPLLTCIIIQELCGKATTFLPRICSVITRGMEEKGGGHRKGDRLGRPGCSDARGMCSLLIQCRDNWYVLATGA